MKTRMKRPGWPAWTLLAVLALTALLGIAFSQSGEPDAIGEDSAIADAAVTKELTETPGLQLQTVTEQTKWYTMDINTVTADHQEVEKPITKWIDEQKDLFEGSVDEYKTQLEDGERAHLRLTAEKLPHNGSLYSLLYTSYQYTGGENGTMKIKTFNIDPSEGRIVELADLFDLEHDGRILQKMVKEHLQEQKPLKDKLFNDLLAIALNDPTSWKWAIRNDRLSIYFDEYEVAVGAAGVVRADIPLDQVRGFLTEEYSGRL
ncbi:RsiV family protein [Bhargavaea massiliensis]|uniref:RsiV family protein n=1 Tax=Bhargavaea massiliensis TaxID=2697500 RepID=UPI001BCD7849|nr:RsiV family protein [Bhargavaea massiliensis]